MISSQTEYQKAREELEDLTRWLAQVENNELKNLTAASVRRMISRIQEEIAAYEAGRATISPSHAETEGSDVAQNPDPSA